MIPSVSAGSFTTDFSVMRRLRTLSRLGTGKIGVLLPDTMTSPRYSEFDAPYLARALQAAGLPPRVSSLSLTPRAATRPSKLRRSPT